jgi:hypothetical protein
MNVRPSRTHKQVLSVDGEVLPAPTYAERILRQAADTLKQRGQVYDSPEGERSMGKTVTAFNTITGNSLTEAEGWLLLQLLKDVRQWSKEAYHEDSAVDCVNYAALKAEALAAK